MEESKLSSIVFRTAVKGPYKEVFERMDGTLFEYLMPKGMPVSLERFDGSTPGDLVHLRFGFPLYSSWVSRIESLDYLPEQHVFVDHGIQLPFPLKHWKHYHRVQFRTENSSYIVDEMYFSTGIRWFDVLIKPFLRGIFAPRKKLYVAYFGLPDEHVTAT